MMKITETSIPGLLIIEPRIYRDARGYFYESFNERLFREHGLDFGFVQDNESRSGRNVIRGLHYQLEPHAQTKLLRVIEGGILDIVVDLRKDSPAFGTWSGIEVSAENKLQVLVPKGCAHGFRVTSENATVFYKCDEFYHPGHERGLLYSDHTLAIDWGIEPGMAVVSDKDKNASPFSDAEFNFVYGKI